MKITIDGQVFEGSPEEIKRLFDLLGAIFPVKAEEETPKFKEGDRVKTIADGEDGEIKAGEVGIIEWIDDIPDDHDPYIIEVKTDDEYDYFRPQDLELVTEEEKREFKKGDIVRVLDGRFSKHTNGDVGEISRVNNDMFDVETARESSIGGWIFAKDIELIAPVESRVDR